MNGPALVRQVPILLAGAAVYAAAIVLAYRAGGRRLERVDL